MNRGIWIPSWTLWLLHGYLIGALLRWAWDWWQARRSVTCSACGRWATPRELKHPNTTWKYRTWSIDPLVKHVGWTCSVFCLERTARWLSGKREVQVSMNELHRPAGAYLVAWLDQHGNDPTDIRVTKVRICSSPASMLSRIGGVAIVDIVSLPGASFAEAHRKMVEYLKDDHYPWIRPWFDPDQA